MSLYGNFYTSVIEFIRKTDEQSYNQIKGSSEEELTSLERKYNISIPVSLREYLKFFGKSFPAFGMWKLHNAVLFSHVEKALKTYRETDSFLLIEDKWCKPNGIDFFPIVFYEDEDYLYFTDQNSLNGIWHHMEDIESLDYIHFGEVSTTDGLRESLFSLIAAGVNKNGLAYETDLKQLIDFSEIDWVKFHLESKSFYVVGCRKKFRKMMKEAEKMSGRVLGFEEYEIEYLKYLMETGRAKPNFDIFDSPD